MFRMCKYTHMEIFMMYHSFVLLSVILCYRLVPTRSRTINLHFCQSQILSLARNHNVDIATCHPSAIVGFGDSSSDISDHSTPGSQISYL